ncbi:hypothetical protein QWZ13_18550 [Reinekea marina]|uniref:hypothetical protein n=1 Tax=Reinekea marina TaxID=1310421 RepID=UPI0025B36227|nr:hypothetical protein [Reinekea marina]MDN3650913.1 hypothetical protein [Reinekea marina]
MDIDGRRFLPYYYSRQKPIVLSGAAVSMQRHSFLPKVNLYHHLINRPIPRVVHPVL